MNLKEKLKSIAGKGRATQFTLADQAWVSGSNFLLGILLTRILGLEQYGVYAFAWMGVMLANNLHQAFMLSPMMTLGPKQPHAEKSAFFTDSFGLQLGFTVVVTGVASVGLGLSGYWLTDYDLASLLPAMPTAIAAFSLQEFFRRYFFTISAPQKALVLDLVAYGGTLLGVAVLGWQGILSVNMTYWIICGAFGLGAIAGWIWTRFSLFRIASLRHIFDLHWRFSKWLVGTSFLQFFSGNYFILAAGALLGPTAIGALRIVQNIMGVTHVIFLAMENFVPVRAANILNETGRGGMYRYLRETSLKGGIVVGGIILCIALSAPYLLSFVYGAEYAQHGYLLVAYCLLYVIIYPGYPLRFALRTLEYTQPIFIAYILSTGFSLLLAYPMVRIWGLMGVVCGLIATQIIVDSWYIFVLKRKFAL